MTQPIFDGHNDAILRLWKGGVANAPAAFEASETGHIDMAKAKEGALVGGFFALFAPPMGEFVMPDFEPPYDVPLPEMLAQPEALSMVSEQAGVLFALERAGLVKICRSDADIEAAVASGKMAAILHMEGAEAIDPDLQALDLFHAAGLRSLGPVWSRPTIFGEGVPFRFPSDGNIGGGLTEAGRTLARRCKALGIIFDTSHLNLAGFWDVAEEGLPLVATHSNAHAISAGARNLTNAQLRAIGETGGMVGLNFGTMFLAEDGRADDTVPLDLAVRHLAHMIELAGEEHVGLGSDFDGAPMPAALAHAGKLQALPLAMAEAGFGAELIDKICQGNWRALLRRTLA